ncbi:DNA-binding transcriptional ArsR family regulator [Agromyces terreus]|uniref:DNA-binding transcriptional ArsR family regulator n=1 Tax=Agromyces terreus TaxID=424795 RepID=A0A9X2KDF6_9MICO|nr:helix-turn-helix domain-containing protein [Agromyces terreus]MCP2369522.1 DNA-binding transcriptional ArsR family regulator [Agromyces terreus]
MTESEKAAARGADRRIDVHDAGSMRALAHPLRLRILGLLRTSGPHSVGMLVEATGAASGSVSYHLGTLAKHGFVVPAPERERDGRERWWKSAHEMTVMHSEEFLGDPERREASEAMRRTVLESYHRELLAALDAEISLDPAWVAASDSSDAGAHLTIDEMRELAAELDAVREKWWALGRGREPRPETRLVRWITHVFPKSER